MHTLFLRCASFSGWTGILGRTCCWPVPRTGRSGSGAFPRETVRPCRATEPAPTSEKSCQTVRYCKIAFFSNLYEGMDLDDISKYDTEPAPTSAKSCLTVRYCKIGFSSNLYEGMDLDDISKYDTEPAPTSAKSCQLVGCRKIAFFFTKIWMWAWT